MTDEENNELETVKAKLNTALTLIDGVIVVVELNRAFDLNPAQKQWSANWLKQARELLRQGVFDFNQENNLK